MIRIDGSYGEGGGQILRTALALSCVTGRAFEIYNIRKRRQNPGLYPQHLTCIKAAETISRAEVEGAEPGSERLRFSPHGAKSGEYLFDVSEVKGSAGSATLVLQSILPALAVQESSSKVRVKGGTHVEWSPSFHYMRDVLLPFLSKIGIRAEMTIEQWGWYPIGGGEIGIVVDRRGDVSSVAVLERGPLIKVSALSILSNLPLSIAKRQGYAGAELLRDMGIEPEVEVTDASSPGKGTFFFVLAEYEHIRAGFSALGALGKRAEDVAAEAVGRFSAYHRSTGALDPYLADQVVPYLAISERLSSFTTSKITDHLLSNAWVTEKFLPVSFLIDGERGGFGKITVKPAG